MASIKEIKEAIEEEKTLQLVTQAYGELAGSKLKKIRADIERGRIFFVEVSQVFQYIKTIAAKKKVFLPSKKDQVASVLLTSNSRFYGSIENEVMRTFMQNTKAYETDRFFVGKTAHDNFHKRPEFAQDQYFMFKHDLPSPEELKTFVDKIRPFKKVLVYYPKFQSVVTQKPDIVNISLDQDMSDKVDPKQPDLQFIFEPEIDKILLFFDTQIVAVLLEQVFLESELARTAARLIAMEGAQGSADEMIKGEKIKLGMAKRAKDNTQLLETISGITGLKKTHGTS